MKAMTLDTEYVKQINDLKNELELLNNTITNLTEEKENNTIKITLLMKENEELKKGNPGVAESKAKTKNYVNNNITHMADEYKKEIKDNYRISMIQKKRDINEIKDIIRHSNLKEQCEFYNKELKKHGVELIYINP